MRILQIRVRNRITDTEDCFKLLPALSNGSYKINDDLSVQVSLIFLYANEREEKTLYLQNIL